MIRCERPINLLVVASAWDETAHAFVQRWASDGVLLLTPFDLSRPGWRCRPTSAESDSAAIADRIIKSNEVGGVITRLPWVTEAELPHIDQRDRAYVATEMHAFLLAWLTRLTCPMLNRPTPFCLSGPSWRQEKWIQTAAELGIAVRPAKRTVTQQELIRAHRLDLPVTSVTVVGKRYVGEVDNILVEKARRLAAGAGVDCLTVYFTDPKGGAQFVGADLWPDLANPEVANVVRRYFTETHSGLEHL